MSLVPSQIVNHIQAYLPIHSDKFSNVIIATSAYVRDTDLREVNVVAADHGLSVGDNIIVSAGELPNLIVSVADNLDGTARFETRQEHDLTQPKLINDVENLTLRDFGPPWDGEHKIDAIPNRKFFDIPIPDGASLPSIGDGCLIETRPAGIVGPQTITNVIGTDVFMFKVTGIPLLPKGDIENFTAYGGLRIWAANDFERATEIYNRYAKDKYALFVIMNDVNVSKDRHTSNDAIATFNTGDLQKLTVLNNFSTFVFIPTKDAISAADAQEECYGDLFIALLSTMYGFKFVDKDKCRGTTHVYTTVTTGHGSGAYNTAYYVHGYDWQRPDVISMAQGFDHDTSVAFRDIDLTQKLFDDEEAVLEADINLDDEPL